MNSRPISDLDLSSVFSQADAKRGLQPTDDLETLLIDAKYIDPRLRRFLAGIADKLDCNYVMGPLKDASQARNKAILEYGGDASRVLDLSRGMLIVPDAHADRHLQSVIQEFRRADLSRSAPDVVLFSDNVSKPPMTGLLRLKFNLRMANGHVVEAQAMNRSMYRAYEETHALYDQVMAIDNRFPNMDFPLDIGERRGHLLKRVQRVHANATPACLRNVRLDSCGLT